MSEKKAFPLRISVDVIDAVQRWADDELRSVNAQIEYVLRDALRRAGRLPQPPREAVPPADEPDTKE
jgi:hypothetical protein